MPPDERICPECGDDAPLGRDGTWSCPCGWTEDNDGEGIYYDAAGQRTETR